MLVHVSNWPAVVAVYVHYKLDIGNSYIECKAVQTPAQPGADCWMASRNESDICARHLSVEHAALANTSTNWTDLWLPTLSCWVGTVTPEGVKMDRSIEKLFLNQFDVHNALF